MRVEVKEKPIRAAFVWLSREEGKNEALLQSLKPQYAAWKAQGYLPVVMESGAGNPKDCLYGLVKHYCEKKGKGADKRRTPTPMSGCRAHPLHKSHTSALAFPRNFTILRYNVININLIRAMSLCARRSIMDNSIQLFEDQPIRMAWDSEKEEWYFP